MLTRRTLLRAAALAGAGAWLKPGFAAAAAAGDGDDRALVLVELTGGNDGLNTVVPYADDRYHRLRPVLRHAPSVVRKLDDALGLAPACEGLAALYAEGLARVELGVGMERPDRSHFESLDRWHTGLGAPDGRAEGWLGRALAAGSPASDAVPAAALGERAAPRLLAGAGPGVVACDRLADAAPSPALRRLLRSPTAAAALTGVGAPADRALDAAALKLAASLDDLLRKDVSAARIPATDLGRRLEDAWRLLTGPVRTRAVFVRTTGFDTHARQDQTHARLLADVDGAVAAFVRALGRAGLADRVLTIVYSEFGRRAAENGGRGTDHGSAGPVFLFGGGLRPGLFGRRPDLGALDDGDVRATTDFRRVLATALRHLRLPADRLAVPPLD